MTSPREILAEFRTSMDDATPFKIDGVYCRLLPLSRKYYAIVEDFRFDYLRKIKWKSLIVKGRVYAVARFSLGKGSTKYKEISMHQFILFPYLLTRKPPKGLVADHRSGCGMDNRVKNLRIATHRQNTQNMRIGKQNTSGYKGVTYNKRQRCWMCQMMINGKVVIKYRGQDKVRAAQVYDEYARMWFGEFACLNFPRDGERSAI